MLMIQPRSSSPGAQQGDFSPVRRPGIAGGVQGDCLSPQPGEFSPDQLRLRAMFGVFDDLTHGL